MGVSIRRAPQNLGLSLMARRTLGACQCMRGRMGGLRLKSDPISPTDESQDSMRRPERGDAQKGHTWGEQQEGAGEDTRECPRDAEVRGASNEGRKIRPPNPAHGKQWELLPPRKTIVGAVFEGCSRGLRGGEDSELTSQQMEGGMGSTSRDKTNTDPRCAGVRSEGAEGGGTKGGWKGDKVTKPNHPEKRRWTWNER